MNDTNEFVGKLIDVRNLVKHRISPVEPYVGLRASVIYPVMITKHAMIVVGGHTFLTSKVDRVLIDATEVVIRTQNTVYVLELED